MKTTSTLYALLLSIFICQIGLSQNIPSSIHSNKHSRVNKGSLDMDVAYKRLLDDHLKRGMSKEDVLGLLGDPNAIEIIYGEEYYLYCSPSKYGHRFYYVNFKNGMLHEHGKNGVDKSEYPNCEEYFPLFIERKRERKKRVPDYSYYPNHGVDNIQQLDKIIEESGKVTMANFRSGNSKPYFHLDSTLYQHLVEEINSSQTSKYKIIGHTNDIGNNEANERLSLDRANATAEKLVKEYGLDLSKVLIIGLGEIDPMHPNDTKENRKYNSRVELVKIKID